MTAAHDQRYDETIFRQACLHFGCEERTLGRFDIGAARRDPERTRKRKRLAETIAKFNAVMSSDNPPRTKQEAVEMVAPFLTMLLSMFLRQFGIEVIEWLWDQLESQDSER
jgi:hypothetical protein